MNDACLQLDRISKHFPGSLALNEATLTVHAGEIHALMGANGAGKSTLMNVLGGLVPKDSGQIYLDGRSIDQRLFDAAQRQRQSSCNRGDTREPGPLGSH